MASAIKCDRCGTISTKAEDFMHIISYTLSSPTKYNSNATEYFDLCQKCYDEMINLKKESEDK